ncbi:MAG: NAD(P)/FAD-dependent oxidoreductase [Terriglobia bacterium]
MKSTTVIVIGGGVTGLSTAYNLARKKYGRIILLDKETVGDGSSSRAAGIITGLLWSETGVLARKKCLALFRELSEELKGYSFREVGCLNLHGPQSWLEAQKLLPMYERLGAPFETVDAANIRRRWPALTPDEQSIGLFDPLGGYSEPDEYIPALARKDRELGVEICEGQEVSGFLTRGGRVIGVKTNAGDIHGDAVICTVLAWTLKVMEPLGTQFPMKAFVHQRYLTEPFPGPINIPAVNANPLGGYVRPAIENRLLVGVETSMREEYRVPSRDFRLSSLSAPAALKGEVSRKFATLVPHLEGTLCESERVGLITFSMDGEPILGPVSQLPGFYVGTAFHSGGFAYNPVSGLLLAEYVADGHTSIDVTAFSPERFEKKAIEQYLAAILRQRDAFQRRH